MMVILLIDEVHRELDGMVRIMSVNNAEPRSSVAEENSDESSGD